MYDIVTVGGATMDLFIQPGESSIVDIRERDYQESFLAFEYGKKIYIDGIFHSPGGGGNNTAVAFARLGLTTGYAGCLGQDEDGRRILRNLKKEGIRTDLIKRVNSNSTGVSIILNSFEGDRTVFSYRGANNDLGPNLIQWEELEKTNWIYLPSISGPNAEAVVSKLVDFAQQHNIRLACNPGGQQLGLGLAGLSNLLRSTEVLVLNKCEAEDLTGLKARHFTVDESICPLQVMRGEPWISDISTIAQRIQAEGCRVVVITEGVKGAQAFDGEHFVWMPPYPYESIDSLGAGDSFAAAFVAGLVREQSILEALQMGAANSALVVQVIGSQPGLGNLAQLKAMIEKHPEIAPIVLTEQMGHISRQQ